MTKEDYDIEVAKEYTTLQERIATLEKENKVLAQNLEDTEILNKAYEKRFSDLKKKNAELEAKNEANENGAKKYAEYYFETNDQLTKAKEIIKKFLLWENDWHNKTESKYELLKEAEQFLSEVEK